LSLSQKWYQEWQGMVAEICNSSFSKGKKQKDQGLRTAHKKINKIPSQQKTWMWLVEWLKW
jgi:hypothetical protein